MTDKPVWFPSDAYKKATRIQQWMHDQGYESYEDFYQASIKDISWFWAEAEKVLGVEWQEPYDETVNLGLGNQWPEWFVNGKLNVVQTALEKWAKNDQTAHHQALIWESENGEVRTYSFKELEAEVDAAAHGLKEKGLSRGELVGIYMPMLPETLIAMLAISKIGAVFAPAFSGYAADAVRTRLNACEAKMLITADGFLRRGKEVEMKKEADFAVEGVPTIETVVIVCRLGKDVPWNKSRDVKWNDLTDKKRVYEAEEMSTQDPMMLIYTSGTTGQPKGAVHTHAGFPVKAAFDAGIGMNVKEKDRLFWFTDMGWMMGPFLVYGALLNGAAVVMYEGSPDYPEPDRMWKLIDKHQVTHLGISPTLIRALMRKGNEWVEKHDLSSLEVIGSTGEPWNPEPWHWLFEKVGKKRIPIFNYSGGTEISGGILGNMLIKPIGPVTFNSPIPGMDAAVYDEHGQEVTGEVGELVIKQPWVGMTRGFWNEPERYENTYWSRFADTWVHGDWVSKDENGFWAITGRSDDILNIAGKRLGPAEMESALVDHPAVAEAGTIGIPDEVKGEAAICFVITKGEAIENEELKQELIKRAGEKLGKSLKPKAIYFVSDLPKTRNAKVMRRAIRSGFLNTDAGDLSALENPEAVQEIQALGQDYFKKSN
ncbi:AMP-binding protein [Salsuginibacillus kocurii]|uniref:AMP-binding protein n=1 Tax=Salsuginibacillus kocurii TaxID=427078 RepID=UPI00037EDBAF|nr:AMP-binding protein [Salsuginibacillus kocurii]